MPKLVTHVCPSRQRKPGRPQKWVSVPVIFVRRKAHEKIAKEIGRRKAANNSKLAIEGDNSRVEACPKIAARIPSSEYVTGVRRATYRNHTGRTEIGYIIPHTTEDRPRMAQFTGLHRSKMSRKHA